MLASVIKEVVARSPFDAGSIDDVNIGCASQAGEDSRCIARHAILLAGLPIDVPGAVFQRNCGSGLNAIISSAHAITCGEGDVFLAGGVESMTRAPFVVGKSEQAFGKDFKVFDSAIGARFPNIADGHEIDQLRSLPADQQRAGWDEFWRRRDPTPETQRNEAMIEFFRRVNYATRHFQGFGPGWRSDMGRIYIKFGPPDQIEQRPATSQSSKWRSGTTTSPIAASCSSTGMDSGASCWPAREWSSCAAPPVAWCGWPRSICGGSLITAAKCAASC